MHALHKLQQSFAADLWDDQLNRLDGVILDGRLPAERLFQVYRNNFWISAEDTLADIYCVIKRLVGDEFFRFMVDHFLRRFPPRYGNVHLLGIDLPVFLYDFKAAAGLPYLSDISRLEWAYHQVFHAAESIPFNTRTLAEVPFESIPQLHLQMATSSQLIYSPFPIFQIWRVNQPDYEGDQSIDLDIGGESILLTRPGLVVELHKLRPGDARFLQSLTTGSNLDKATQDALKTSNNFDLETALARYLVSGVLVLSDKSSSEAVRKNNPAGGNQP